MTCDIVPVEDLIAFADGELSGEALARVREHVAGCAVCAREAELFIDSGALLASMRRIEPTPGFVDRVVAQARRARGGRLLRLRPWKVAAAALLLAAGVGAAWFSSGTLDPTDPRDMPVLTASEEDAIARDLYLLSNLAVLEESDVDDLVRLVEDLDVVESLMEEEQEG